MPHTSTRRPAHGTPSTNGISKVADSLQKLNIGKPSRTVHNSGSTRDEDGFTTVQHGKPTRPPAKIAFAKEPKAGRPTTNSIYDKTGHTSNSSHRNANRAHEAHLIPTIGNNTPSPPRGTHLGVPSAAAGSTASAFTSSNWRNRDLNQPIIEEPHRGNSRANDVGGHTLNRKKYPRSFYRPGIIIRAALHEEELMGANSVLTAKKVTSKSVTPSQHGNIFSTARKMIVVATFERHYIAIPLYTHNGQGLLNKKPDEYVSVRDHRDGSTEFKALSRHGKLTTEYLHQGIVPYEEKTTAHITYHLSRKYDYPVIYEGYLRDSSVKHLLKLYNTYAPEE